MMIGVHGSGGLLSLGPESHVEVSVPRPRSQHDQRQLRFLHVLSETIVSHGSAVDLVQQVHRRPERHAQTSTNILRR